MATDANTRPVVTRAKASPRTERHVYDALVVGAGPSGSAAAYWLADAGYDVAVIERKRFPREKTCGDGLTPRAVRQLEDMGLGDIIARAHRYVGLRTCAYGHQLELRWPDHPSFPSYGYVITRHDLDMLVAERAAKAGARIFYETEAIEPVIDMAVETNAPRGERLPKLLGINARDVKSGHMEEFKARYIILSEGTTSRISRHLGAARDKRLPLGMALRGYYTSPLHDDPFIESHLDVRDSHDNVLPGYGWIFPLGDGRVNVGVGLITTAGRWKGVNTGEMLDTFIRNSAGKWGLSPKSACGPATGGRLPMGLSISPKTGTNVLLTGDAAGSINPFNGEGISYGYETGRLAAACVAAALCGAGEDAMYSYEDRLQDAYGLYYKIGRSFVRMISNPEVMHRCVQAGMHSNTMMGWLLRIMANLLRPDETAPAEMVYRALLSVARVTPDPEDFLADIGAATR
ncbi:MAG: geranylgeranyl reductase family protein [Actinobacteria bacterium]|nr:geranylgeranyl reductase family protein [Actinomycetota bacterium]